MSQKRGPKPRKDAASADLWAAFWLPESLSEPAKAEFLRLEQALEAVGTKAATDPRIVLAAARVSAMLDAAFASVDAKGLTVIASNGTLCPNPCASLVNPLVMRLRGLWADMGLTADSAKLGTVKAAPQVDKWEGLLGVVG